MSAKARYIFYVIFFLFVCVKAYSNRIDYTKKSILIISSYNPSSRLASNTISDFIEEYHIIGGSNDIIIENMNCKSFSDVMEWESKLGTIFSKYTGRKAPQLIILMGQEAWATYLSVDDSIRPDIPVLCSLVSRNFIYLPHDSVDVQHWKPESMDFLEHKDKYPNVVSGYMYNYELEANIDLIKKVYPATSNLLFLSDNTYGGVSLQAMMRKVMKNHSELDITYLDGREHTIYTLIDEMSHVPDNSALMVGTWRIDKTDGYFMPNATYLMMEASPSLPAFTPTSVALGHWTIGGVTPDYPAQGKGLAKEAFSIIHADSLKPSGLELIDNCVMLDYNKIQNLNINYSGLDYPVKIVNKPQSFYEQYFHQIWLIIMIMVSLILALLLLMFYYVRMRKLYDKLAKSEVELKEAKNAAEESNRLKSAFLANMSHEIRTPLNAIVGFTDVISSGEVSQEVISEYNDIIKSNSDLLLRLINDILDMSRLESGKLTLDKVECDAIDLCRQTLATVDLAHKNGNKLNFISETDSFKLHTDPQRLQQVIINLLSNASKFTREGTITLSVHSDAKNNFAHFSVTDTGCGIPAEKQKQVFERFEKLNEYAQGTGLGLAICKLIVMKAGGNIWIDPEYTQGARFIFTIPFSEKTEE